MNRTATAVLQSVADLYAPAARETILCENFDKHLTELELIGAALPPAGALLDLGGGVGVNLVCLRQLGHRGRLVLVDRLVEYDDANRMGSGARARALLQAHDIEISETDFWPVFHSGHDDGSFDVVTCFDVIEHLPGNPRQQLNELVRILRGGGTAIVGAPNAASLMKRVKLIAGVHPYAPFNTWMQEEYYGHFREYTAAEYESIVTSAGLVCQQLIRSAAIPRTRARQRYHRKRHGLLSPVALALAAEYAVEAVIPALRHSVYVVGQKQR